MAISKQDFSNYIKQFKLKELFNDIGWDQDRTSHPVAVDKTTYQLNAVAQKSGFKILICNPLVNGNIPDYNSRKKIETKVIKLFQEHLLIFTDAKKQEQIWQLVVRQPGKPTKVTETRYHISQDPELLYQRAAGLFFELDEEEHITIIDVTKRVADNFHQNNERVTKQFYDRFKQQHTAFLKFIKGIDDKVNQDWYASLMLNRLMFCYFIQKKGFLDNNKNYLSNKLKECQQKKGKDKFYSFYRSFLLQLFHHGLGAPDHSKALTTEIGKIPYLNGGLFDVHELEINHVKIEIDDKAFESIFKFFNEWEWHLDTRHTASGKDINPDVIGYIFEKYINDRADMGAYYTKEDITDYISKNCILPFLFDETKRQQPKAFNADAEIWKAVKESSDQYIYEAVKKGAEEKLPKEIADGIKNVSARTKWNKPAKENIALPTEIWREVVDRRNRYTEIKNKIQNGEVRSINDFITYNLNIRQFAIDSIANTNDPDFLKSFYKSLNSVTIIDPTCGSGAFLFAAMNILEELYEQCIQRMQNFVSDAPKGKYKFFEETIGQVMAPEHPNLQYFIFKNIILRNLYGVDIMKEAVEIAKLRLFLKLVATVEANYRKPNLGLEPLPDIDFNIRSGNALVGFGSKQDVEYASRYLIDGADMIVPIEEKTEIVAKTFERYKEIQLSYGDDFKAFKKAKEDLSKRLKELNHNLNLLLHKQASSIKYDKWLDTYKPFHWWAEFYEITQKNKGFDVIIGNPPYVNFKKVNYTFNQNSFKCIDCKDLFALTIERSFSIIKANGRNGFIIPLSGLSIETMSSLRNFIFTNTKYSWNSYYSASDQPASLFNGVRHRLLITINEAKKDSIDKKRYSTNFLKWFSSERGDLFLKFLKYSDVSNDIPSNSKISCSLEKSLLQKLSKKKTLNNYIANSGSIVYYHNAPVHWGKIFDFVPYFAIAGKQQQSSHLKELFYNSKEDAAIVICLLNSSLFYWFNWQYSNCRDLSQKDIFRMPISLDKMDESEKKLFVSLKNNLMKDLKKNSKLYQRVSNKIRTEFDSFYPLFSKSIIDEIDTALAEHYGFTDEELDFIINYDIKYRMGKELEGEEQ